MLLLAALFTALGPLPVHADMKSDAVRLLAHRVRQRGVDPKNIVVSDVVVSGNQALLSWNAGKQRGVMGLLTSADRWWDALDMTASMPETCWQTVVAYPLAELRDLVHFAGDSRLHPARTCSDSAPSNTVGAGIQPAGGMIHPPIRRFTSGYDITIAYARNDAAPNVKLTQLFARPPTQAEFAPNHPPAPGWGGPDAVCFFDVGIAGSKPVTFERGTAIDVWFPFVLDDQLRYNLSFMSAGKPSGMIFGSVFDNTLHFVLPAFTIDAREPLMAQIDGD
jgi:hypothetical protein